MAGLAIEKNGVTPREIKEQEIVDRMILPMISECAKILDEVIVRRSSDIDVVWDTGYGWPLDKSGPAYYGDMLGLNYVLGRLRELRTRHGDCFAPAPLIEKLAAEGRTLASAVAS